jgi:similar to spore coat protein
MMNLQNNMLAPHETLEVHELLRSELTCYKKLQANMSIVQDNELKQFMNEAMNSKQRSIEQLQQFIASGSAMNNGGMK